VEVAVLRIPVPWAAAGSAGAAGAAVPVRGTAGSAAVAVGVTAALRRAVEAAGCAGRSAMVTARSTGSAVVPAGGRRAVVTTGPGPSRPRSGVGQAGPHAECGCAKRTGDG
jgi:hypothetical protein